MSRPEVLSRYLPGETEESHEIPQHSNRASLESCRYTILLVEGRSSVYCRQYGDYALVATTFILTAHCLAILSYFIRNDRLAVTYRVPSTTTNFESTDDFH
jgi:hypothetical protein